MDQPADLVDQAQDIADRLKSELDHESALEDAARFFGNSIEEQERKITLLVDMGVMPFIVHIVKSCDQVECSKLALMLLDLILVTVKNQRAEIVDVNLVKALIAKLQEPDFAPYAASSLTTIAQTSISLSCMVRNHGLMEAILVTARKCGNDDNFTELVQLLSVVFDNRRTVLPQGAPPAEKRNFFIIVLAKVHELFESGEFEDSPESLHTVLPLITYLMDGPNVKAFEGRIVCTVLTDFFRHPMPSKVSQIEGINFLPLLARFLDSTNQRTFSAAITCVASLAGSGPSLASRLLSNGVVRKLAKTSLKNRASEGVCWALSELARHCGSEVMASMHGSLLRWLQEQNDNVGAYATLVRMIHAEDTIPGRVQKTLGHLLGHFCSFVIGDELQPEFVLTHLQIALDFADKHPSVVDESWRKCHQFYIKAVEKYTDDRSLLTSEKARALLKRFQKQCTEMPPPSFPNATESERGMPNTGL